LNAEYVAVIIAVCMLFPSYLPERRPNRVSTTPGNPGNLLEFNWSSWKFLCKLWRSTALVSSHKTGYL